MQDENLYKQIPNITDIESLTHLAEKLACDGKRPIDWNLFREYIEIIYNVCDKKIYDRDKICWEKPYLFNFNHTTQSIEANQDAINSYGSSIVDEVSYIVNTYYSTLRGQFNESFMPPQQATTEILKAIDFVAQFK